MIFYSRSQRYIIHRKIARFATMLLDLRVKILRLDLGSGLGQGFNLLNNLMKIVNAETDSATLVRRFRSLQRVGTFGVSGRQRQNFSKFERTFFRRFMAQLGDVLDLEKRYLLDT
ncbi:hypothetical protein SAMN04487962_106181 [Marinobacter segnicrescens]|uniref:Uncharacterized protein n=1 Tax=Marinobacter segnicrescens TaxID=430453 RepID=A0A1I0D6Y0_9GAMM|nr:hypothetical protein SAMN04487962_106181 [Marinobacter segnicrescens]